MATKITNNALVATVAGVLLVSIVGIIGYYITRPYIQYEEGQFYKTGNVAVASLRLENKGYFDAEEVSILATFAEPIIDITSGDAITQFVITNGGKGTKTVVGNLSRIVPSQATYVYFAIDNSSGGVGEGGQSFVKQVTFKNGKGSSQPPLWTTLPITILSSLVGSILGLFIIKYRRQSIELKEIERMARKAVEEHKEWVAERDKQDKEFQERLEKQKEESEKFLAEHRAKLKEDLTRLKNLTEGDIATNASEPSK